MEQQKQNDVPEPVESLAVAMAANRPFIVSVVSDKGIQSYCGGDFASQLGLLKITEMHITQKIQGETVQR